MDILLGEIDIATLTAVVKRVQLKGKLSFIAVDEDATSAALVYYKKPSLDMTRPISVSYGDSNVAIDAGGPKRQFYCDALLKLRDSFGLFEGTNNRLLP